MECAVLEGEICLLTGNQVDIDMCRETPEGCETLTAVGSSLDVGDLGVDGEYVVRARRCYEELQNA